MRLSMLVNPFSDGNLQLAAQVGVSDIVLTYPGLRLEPLLEARRRVESFGMRLSHLERKIPHLKFVHGLDGRDAQVEDFKTLIRNMAAAGMEVLCYNWMPDEDWQRTSAEVRERGGARVTEFNADDLGGNVTDADGRPETPTSAEQLWSNLERFLREVVPVAEEAGIKLALHPDDPPLPVLRGQPRIITSVDALARVVELVPSPVNGICMCVGTLAPTGADMVEGIRRLAPRIHFAHLRNTTGGAEHFRETFPDTGDLDMPAIVSALHQAGYEGTARPDHAPSLAGESNETPGYEMLGRLYAAGYFRALMQSAR
jgi:mannonate dehydratase